MTALRLPHCTRCGATAEAGNLLMATNGERWLVAVHCEACPEAEAYADGLHCLICGELTGGVGPVEPVVLLRGLPVEVVACLGCYDLIARERPEVAWVPGMAAHARDAMPVLQ